MLHFYPPLRFEYRLLLRSVNSAEPHGDPSLPSKCTQPLWNSDSHSCPVLAAKEESEKCSAAAALLAGSGTSCLAGRKALVHLVLYTVPFKTCQAVAKTALLHPKWQHFLLRNSCSNWLCPAPDSGFYWDIFTRRLPSHALVAEHYQPHCRAYCCCCVPESSFPCCLILGPNFSWLIWPKS